MFQVTDMLKNGENGLKMTTQLAAKELGNHVTKSTV